MSPKSVVPVHNLIVQPDDGIEPVAGAITRAERILRMKQYTFVEPGLIRATIEAHRRGVDVRVLLNRSRVEGTRDNDASFKTLQEAGVNVRWATDRYVVTHEKSIVVDDARAFILSFNLAQKFFQDTRDHGIVTSDPLQVAQIVACFEADWEDHPFEPAPDSDLIWSPHYSREPMARFIDGTNNELLVHHPKFVDMTILDRLTDAAARGVRVRVLSGGMHGLHNDDTADTASSLRIMRRLGIKVRALKHPKVHCKMMIADHARLLVGSMNLRPDAFDIRRELGIIVDEPTMVARAATIFEQDWESAKRYDAPDPVEARKQAPPAISVHDFID